MHFHDTEALFDEHDYAAENVGVTSSSSPRTYYHEPEQDESTDQPTYGILDELNPNSSNAERTSPHTQSENTEIDSNDSVIHESASGTDAKSISTSNEGTIKDHNQFLTSVKRTKTDDLSEGTPHLQC
jgi:hypothetical protein